MSSLLNQREFGVRRVEWFELFGRIAVTSAGYPLEYVKVLIQVGHEPFPPRETRTLLGRRALALPGAWAYIKHIKKIDGFFGLYRGLAPKLCANLLSGFTYTMMLDRLPSIDVNQDLEDSEEELTEKKKVLKFFHQLIRETVSRCTAVFASHPLHIISVRMMAQFVGREEKYCGVYGSLREIYHQEGIFGFFSGLVPRLIGEVLTLWFSNVVSYLVNSYIIEEKALQGYAKTSALYLASALFYPFVVVSNCSAVNNCGSTVGELQNHSHIFYQLLAAGMPPHMPIYDSWTDCWSHLSTIGQLKRGSSILWRYYHGPLLRTYEQNYFKKL